ncbi:MAG: hypothetical protein C4288_13375 [Leptolyngbya sp. ERB_1_1]
MIGQLSQFVVADISETASDNAFVAPISEYLVDVFHSVIQNFDYGYSGLCYRSVFAKFQANFSNFLFALAYFEQLRRDLERLYVGHLRLHYDQIGLYVNQQ